MLERVSRRRFVQGAGVAGLGLLAGCGRWPGQVPIQARPARIGYLMLGTAQANASLAEEFRAGLRALGYVEGQNLTIEARYADNAPEKLPELAAELVRLPVDAIVTAATQPAR